MNKQQKQAYKLLMDLEVKPRNLDVAGRYVDAFLINWNFEAMKHAGHLESIATIRDMLAKYRQIRGR